MLRTKRFIFWLFPIEIFNFSLLSINLHNIRKFTEKESIFEVKKNTHTFLKGNCLIKCKFVSLLSLYTNFNHLKIFNNCYAVKDLHTTNTHIPCIYVAFFYIMEVSILFFRYEKCWIFTFICTLTTWKFLQNWKVLSLLLQTFRIHVIMYFNCAI